MLREPYALSQNTVYTSTQNMIKFCILYINVSSGFWQSKQTNNSCYSLTSHNKQTALWISRCTAARPTCTIAKTLLLLLSYISQIQSVVEPSRSHLCNVQHNEDAAAGSGAFYYNSHSTFMGRKRYDNNSIIIIIIITRVECPSSTAG